MTCSPSDRFSAESGASTLALNEPGICELCGSASRTRSASESSRSTGPESRSTATCAPLWPTPDASVAQLGEQPDTWLARMRELKEKHGNGNGHGMPLTMAAQLGPTWRMEQGLSCPCRCHTSMSSAAASPAKTSATPAGEPGSKGNARVFGRSTPDSFANYDPVTSSWRTSQLSLLEDSGEFSETWPRAGMTRSGTAFRLVPLAPLTGGTGSGLWPAPTARDHKDTGDLRGVPENSLLPRVVQRAEREKWATPTAWLGRRPSQATGDPNRWHDPKRSNELSDSGSGNGNARGAQSDVGVLADGLSAGLAGHWAAEPDVGRVAVGVPERVAKLRSLGNALVPQIAEWIGRRIVEYEAQEGRLAA